MKKNHHSILPFAGAAFLSLALAGAALAASPAIGLAVANGSFQVDHAQVWGSCSLFEGSTVETILAGSEIQVNGGVNVRLAADSRAQVYRSRMVLEQGFTQIQTSTAYPVEVRSLKIAPEGRQAVARIRLQGMRKVTVAAVGGPVDVRNGGGLLVARVEPGTSLDFEPQTPVNPAGATSGTSSGDQTGAGTTTPQTGSGGQAGASGGGAAGTGTSGTAGAAGAAGAGTAGATATGIGAGTIAIIGGVAVAATLGGLAATGSLPGQGQSTPSASR